MNTLANVLNEKLKLLGYTETIRSTAISKIDMSLIENKLNYVEDYSEYVEVYQFDEPTVEIIKTFLNVNNKFIYCDVLEGDIRTVPGETIFRTRFVAANYSLYKRCVVIAVSNDFKIKIYVYSPSQKIQTIYEGKTYEDLYKRERDSVTLEYKEAFERNKRLQVSKVSEILTMLVEDFVIDEMIVRNVNPRLKMYDDPEKYAENITAYSLRFINNKTNRIEIYETQPRIRRLGSGVIAGISSNDPYIRLEEMPVKTNFSLRTISYYWLEDNGKRQEEIGIYIASRYFEESSFVEMKYNSIEVKMIIEDILKLLKRTAIVEADYSNYVSELVKSLNIELVNPSIQVIIDGLEHQADSIIPISYGYKFITDPKEFEDKLYISIEDNIGREYKYNIAENVLEDLTRVGIKLEYTNDKGEYVRRQSIADFNVNSPTAIIRRETFINESRISDLLAYMYHEESNESVTEKLPIPSTEVCIYIPKTTDAKVCMYNGTSLEFTLDGIRENNLFGENSLGSGGYIEGGTSLPGSTYVTVKYVNSKDEVLKENKIGNLFPNSTFAPEIIPIINDIQGKEWRAELTRIDPIIVSSNPEFNIIKLKYIEKFTRVTFSFINREGKKIADDKQEIIQVGETYDFESKKSFIASNNEEWHLRLSRPSKFVAKDDEEKNKVILVYDIERTDILIKYINKNTNEELLDSKKIVAVANKRYSVDVPKFILSGDGLGWNYIEGTDTNILAKPNIINEVNLYYVEAKAPVLVRFKNESGIKLMDDKVELIQIGKKYSFNFEDEVSDYQCREWRIKTQTKSFEIIVSNDKEKNTVECIYEPVLANVTIKFLNTDNRPIKGDLMERAQIGEIFNSERLEEITDNYQKVWKCIDRGEKIVVKSKEIENVVILKYEPYMVDITLRYLDAEQNELIEPKQKRLQVGSVYKDRPIEKFTSKDGKRWKINLEKIDEVVVNKYEEENIFSIYYEKETAKVKLTFFDAYNNELREEQVVESQIGALLETKAFEKISDEKGQRWMMETSEPKNLTVKENNNFIKLIYGEIKAKVLVKSIDIKTQKPIVDNILTTVKLGGIYIPNIQNRILDKNKYYWKYVGDENISIVTKENEQENIIILNYEEDTAKVILKYKNLDGEKIREDSVKDVQIGKEIKVEPTLKFADNNGLIWKYNSIKIENKIVEEKDNLVHATYEPVIADIKIRYINENDEDIVEPQIVKMQDGKIFEPEILERVTGKDNRIWVYNKISEDKIIVKEETNEILMTFDKLMSDITIQLVDVEGNLIAKPNIYSMQVGEIFIVPFEKAYVDMDDKAWILNRIDKEKLSTNELMEKNIVKVWYEKELVDVKMKYFNNVGDIIRNSTTEKVQIGSIYNPKPFAEIIDEKTKLGWKLPDNFKINYKVKRDASENLIEIKYEELKVKVAVRYKDAKDVEIIKETLYSEQVGTTFTPKVEQVLIDDEDKEWLYGLVEESKLFAGNRNKIESIFIAREESKNFIDLKYRPSLIKVTIKYQEPLGKEVKADKIVDAQIGSIYEAEIIDTILDSQKVKWVYNPNSKPKLKVGREEKDNIIILAYEEEKALVTYKYHDEYGNRLRSPKRKLVQIGSLYEPEIENIIEDLQGRVWEYKARSINKLEVNEDETTNIIEIIYIPLKVDTILRFVNLQGKQISKDVIIKAQLGSEYTPDIQEKLTDADSKLFKFVRIKPEIAKIKEVPVSALESPNVFELTYEAVYSDVKTSYKTIDGKKIKEDDIKQLQVGSIFDPIPAQFVKDEEGIQWELISKDIDSIRVMEDERENIVSMVYEVAKAEVTVRYKDMDGNNIIKSDIIQMEVGKEFIPEIKNEIIDEDNKKWVFSVAEPVKLTVGSINNIINVIYQEKKVPVVVKYKTKEGKTIKEDQRIKIQVGTRFEAQNNTKVIYEDNLIWRFSYNEPSMIIVSENVSENVITHIYTKEEREIENKVENKGYYNPEIEKFLDKDLMAEVEREEKEKKENLVIESKVEFEGENLKILARSITLTDDEKIAINKLNEYNSIIIKKLDEAIVQNINADFNNLESEITELMNLEKHVVLEKLNKLIEDDKSGRQILKIFEAITSSELDNRNWYVLQQKRAISMADYFINKQISENEQALYICEKGKVEKSMEGIEQMLSQAEVNVKKKEQTFDKAELARIKIKLTFEKLILNNYNKARNEVKDKYFIDDESKGLIEPAVVVIVANTLPKQAYKLISKITDLSLEQTIELKALVKLMNSQQLGTLATMIEKNPDGKMRKLGLRYLKDFQN